MKKMGEGLWKPLGAALAAAGLALGALGGTAEAQFDDEAGLYDYDYEDDWLTVGEEDWYDTSWYDDYGEMGGYYAGGFGENDWYYDEYGYDYGYEDAWDLF